MDVQAEGDDVSASKTASGYSQKKAHRTVRALKSLQSRDRFPIL